MNKENKLQLSSLNKGAAAGPVKKTSAGNAMLPEIGGKFSSWAKEDQNLNELDELLMEHDLLNENPAKKGANRANGA